MNGERECPLLMAGALTGILPSPPFLDARTLTVFGSAHQMCRDARCRWWGDERLGRGLPGTLRTVSTT